MNERDPQLMSIGRFSEATRLSVKALRLYDDLGLLVPEHVDTSNGYRYYGPSQTPRAEAIRVLRSVDMPLEEIGRVLDSNPESRDRYLAGHLERMEKRLTAQQLKIAALSDLTEGRRPLMPYEVSERQVGAQQVAAVTREVTMESVGAAVGEGFGSLMGALTTAGVPAAGAPFIIMHEVIDEESSGDIEICIPVAGVFDPKTPVESKEIPGGLAAGTIHKGAYEEVAGAYHALSAWMSANDYEPHGPPREVYLNDPAEVSVSEQLTEVLWPIHKIGP